MPRHDYDPATVPPDGRPATSVRIFDPETSELPRGRVNGEELGGPVTVLVHASDEVGTGPVLHVHPYDETFVILVGRARFQVGDTVIEASAGEVVLGPKGVPHKFENIGPGRLQTVDIHHSPVWIQTDLE